MMNNLLKPRTWLRATSSRLAAFVLVVTAVGGGLSAFATTYTWTGGGTANQDGSYNWNDTANWSVPTSDTDETTGAVTYQLANVCTVGGVGYTSLDNAKAALTEENDTIVLTAATPSKLTVGVGETVKLDNPDSLSWGGIAWPANGYVESVTTEGTVTTYAALDNTAATWTNGSGDNKWSTAANWSTGYAPDSATVVTLPEGTTIYTGAQGTAGYCGGMVVDGAVTISSDANMSKYTKIECYGNITGSGTLTLARAGIDGGSKAITIDANLAFTNNTAAYAVTGNDSWLENGTFTVNGAVTGAGLLRTYASTTFNGAVTLNNGTISSQGGQPPTFNGAVTLTGKSGIYTYAVTYNGVVTLGDDAVISVGSSTQSYGSGFVLNGSGTWIGDTQLPGNAVQTCLRNNKDNVWAGVCELYNLTVSNNLTPDSYANNNSTVRFKGVTTGCLKAGTYTCGIELAGNGLTISGDYSRNITFSGKFSGSGALKVGTVGSSGFNLYITGDYSGFTGGVQFTNASNRNRRVVFGASSTTSTGSCVVIAQGASLTVDSGAVWGPTNLVVLGEITFNGTLNIPAGGIWGSGNTGNRTIRFNDLSKAPNCAMFAGSWNGTCVLGDPAADGTEIKFYNFGNANSTIELAGVTAGYIGINGNTNVTSKVVLSGNVKLTNGWPTTVQAEGSMPTTRLTTLASVGGTGDLELNYTGTSSSWSSSSKGHIVVNKLDGAYTGDITIGNFWLLEVDAVDFAAAPTTAGSALIGLTVAENGTLYNAAHNAVTASNGKTIDVTVAGAASTEKLVLGYDGLYLAVASVGGAYYATLQDAVDAAGANTVTLLADGQSAVLDGGSSVKIAKGGYSCTITAGEGYTLSDTIEEGVTTYTTTLQYAAKIGSTYYDTVDEALLSLGNNRDAVVEVLDSTYTVRDTLANELLTAGIIWDSDARTFAWAVVKDGNNLYASVAAAITGGATSITLFKNVTENVVLPAGVSFSAGSYTLTGMVTAASGSLLGVKNGVYTAYASNTAEEWVGGVSGNEWTVADNWSLGFVPVATTPVTFTAGEHSVVVTGWGTATCASMTVNGTLTITQTLSDKLTCYCLDVRGNVSGEGKIVLSHAGIWNATSGSVTISVPIEVVATSDSTEVSRIGGVLNNGGDAGAIVLTSDLTVEAGARLQYEIDVQLNGGKLEVDGYMINKSGGYAKWLKVNGGTVNLNEGGELSICRFTAVGAMAINFNGGTLTEYGSGGNFDKIIGGQTDSWGDQGTITLTVKEKGLTVNTDANTTILPVLAGDGESTGGGLTKMGSGTLTLSATPTFTGAITVEGGSVVVPVAADVTLGGETYVSIEDGTTKTLSKHPGYAADSDGTAGDETVAVPLSWVKSNVDGFDGMTEEQIVTALAANSATMQANGYNYFTCYALGLDPADADDKPVVSVSVDSKGYFVVALTDKDGNSLTTADNVTVTPSFYKYEPDTGAYYEETSLLMPIAPSDVAGDGSVGYIRAKIEISAE